MIPEQLSFLAKPLNQFESLQPNWLSLLRITVWVVAFLIVISWGTDKLRGTHSAGAESGLRVTQMLTATNDPRWAVVEPTQFPADGIKNLVWVSGSAGKLVTEPPILTASLVADALEKDHGLQARAFVYYMEAARSVDVLVATQDAIARKPDVLAIEIDPLWIYNSVAVYRNEHVFNRAAALWWNEWDWQKQFLFVAPRNHMWAIVGKYLPRINLGSVVRFLESAVATNAPPPRTNGESKRFLSAIQFWVTEGTPPRGLKVGFNRGSGDGNAWQDTALLYENAGTGHSWAHRFLSSLFLAIQKSGIPALIFVAPVAPEIKTNPDTAIAYGNVIAALNDIGEIYSSEKIQLITAYPEDVEQNIVHPDRIHMKDPGLLPEFLAKHIVGLSSAQ